MRSYIHGGSHNLRRIAGLALVVPAIALSGAFGAPAAFAAESSTADAKLQVEAPEKLVPGTEQQIVLRPSVNADVALIVDVVVPHTAIVKVAHPGWTAKSKGSNAYRFEIGAAGAKAAAEIVLTVETEDGTVRTSSVRGQVSLPTGADANPDNDLAEKRVPVDAAAAIGGTIWHDKDGNGLREKGEPLVAGVSVGLFRMKGDDDAELVKALDELAVGKYSFAHQPAGTYRIVVITPDNSWTFTKANAGDDTKDSDVVGVPLGNDKALAPKARKKLLAKLADPADPAEPTEIGVSDEIVLDGAKKVLAVDAGLVKVAASTPPGTPAPGDGGSLPTTGASLPIALGSGGALLAGGIALTVLARRRRSAAEAA